VLVVYRLLLDRGDPLLYGIERVGDIAARLQDSEYWAVH
jgi:hypothetical protein